MKRKVVCRKSQPSTIGIGKVILDTADRVQSVLFTRKYDSIELHCPNGAVFEIMFNLEGDGFMLRENSIMSHQMVVLPESGNVIQVKGPSRYESIKA